MSARTQLVTTEGIFTEAGTSFDVVNNIWIVGDDEEVIVIDAGHDAQAIADAVAGRRVQAIICLHGFNDHCSAAPELAKLVEAPVALHPADLPLWHEEHPGAFPDVELADGDTFTIAGTTLTVLHTPGRTPGSVALYDGESVVYSGDTLFPGGPGATSGPWSDFGIIITTIEERLFTLPPRTTVLTGHGDSTTVGAESPSLSDWKRRGA